VNVNAVGDVVLSPFAVPKFEVRQSTINLPEVKKEFAAFFPKTKVEFPSGTIFVQAAGRMDERGTTLTSLKVNPQNLTIKQDEKTVLEGYTGTLELAGELRQQSKDMKNTVDAKLSKLSLTDQKNLLTIEKAGDGDLVFNLQADGSFTGNGKLAIKNADLKKLSDIAQAAGTNPPPAENEPGQIKSGNLAGTLELVRANADQTVVVGDLTATNLTITDPQNLVRNERVIVSLRANADKTFSLINLSQLDVQSTFMRMLLSDAVIHRPVGGAAVSPLEMVEKARMVMDVPDLKNAYSLVMAFMPRTSTPEPEVRETPKRSTARAAASRVRKQYIGSERISSGPV